MRLVCCVAGPATTPVNAILDAASAASAHCYGQVTGSPLLALTTGDYEEAYVKRALSEASSRTIVLASPDKFNTASPFQIAPLSQVNDIIVHRDVDDALVAPYREMGIAITLA